MAFPADDGSGTKGGFLSQCVAPVGRGGFNPLSRLLPRALDKIDAFPNACPCNQTYVSRACCDSQDGTVWEANELKLGALIGMENS